MGKTKLLHELHKRYQDGKGSREGYKSIFVICRTGTSFSAPTNYGETLACPEGTERKHRDLVPNQLDLMIKKTSGPKIILLVDEAQHLLQQFGFGFRCFRWWIRVKRRNNR